MPFPAPSTSRRRDPDLAPHPDPPVLRLAPPSRRVTGDEAARALLHPDRARTLLPFLDRARSVTEAARELRVKPNTLLYRVRRLVELGLLCEAGEAVRGGRKVRLYRAAAESFFVPFEAARQSTPEEFLACADAPWRELHRRSAARALRRADPDRIGVRFTGEGGRARYAFEAPGAPDAPVAVRHEWAALRLDAASAAALEEELRAVLRRYARRSGGGRVLIHWSLVPLAADDALAERLGAFATPAAEPAARVGT